METHHAYDPHDEHDKWTLIHQGLPCKAPRDLATCRKLAKRYGLEVTHVWLAEDGKFAPLTQVGEDGLVERCVDCNGTNIEEQTCNDCLTEALT